jgi:hypothetical protein
MHPAIIESSRYQVKIAKKSANKDWPSQNGHLGKPVLERLSQKA